ncbi:MAG: hypothetical protein SXU28_09085 [Pseudomonadota bacterium]|nr:hypothetical protein [Pseudomonadota bacterium]
MKFFDRLLTIVITATITSAVWIIFGSTFMEAAERDSQDSLLPESEVPAQIEPPLEEVLPAPEPVSTQGQKQQGDNVARPVSEPNSTRDTGAEQLSE